MEKLSNRRPIDINTRDALVESLLNAQGSLAAGLGPRSVRLLVNADVIDQVMCFVRQGGGASSRFAADGKIEPKQLAEGLERRYARIVIRTGAILGSWIKGIQLHAVQKDDRLVRCPLESPDVEVIHPARGERRYLRFL